MGKRTLFSVLGILLVIFFTACGGGGGSDPPPPPPPPDPEPVYGISEGTISQPVPLTIGQTHSGTAGVEGSYYKFTASSSSFYIINATNVSDHIEWELFSDSGFQNSITYNHIYSGSEDRVVALEPATYYLDVTNWGFTIEDPTATYGLAVTEVITGEGDALDPVPLIVNTVHSGSADGGMISYYTFTADADGMHFIKLSNFHYMDTISLTLDIYDTDFDIGHVKTCTISSWSTECKLEGLLAGDYFLKVTETSGKDIMYDIKLYGGLSEGTKTSPVPLIINTPHQGGVDHYSSSYYTFNSVSDWAGSYFFNLDAGSLNVYVYSDDSFSNSVGSCTGSCVIDNLNSNTPYYMRVNESWGWDTPYTLTVIPGMSEGSVNEPVPLVVNTPHQGGVEYYQKSYYTFTTETSGEHFIQVTNSPAGNLDVLLYRNADFSSSRVYACDTFYTGAPECNTGNLDAGVPYYLLVESTGDEGPYTVTVSYAGGEGTDLNPVPLAVGTPYLANIAAEGTSHYSFTTDATGGDYAVVMENTTEVQIELSDDPFTYTPKTCWPAINNICTLYIAAPSTTYYVDISQTGDSSVQHPIKVVKLDPAAGCEAGAAQCFDFEDGLMPSGFTEPNGGFPWKVVSSASATGTYSIISDKTNNVASCVEYTRPENTWRVSFSLSTANVSGYSLYLQFYVDGNWTSSWYQGEPWRRETFRLTPGTNHVFRWCAPINVETGGALLDDIEFY